MVCWLLSMYEGAPAPHQARSGRGVALGRGTRARDSTARCPTGKNVSMVNVVICSALEADLVDRIRGSRADVTVTYRPDLLPVPRHTADHHGERRDLSPEQIKEWGAILAGAEVCFDFDWLAPASMAQESPGLRWVQATSAGVGGFMERTGLSKSGITVTTAAGVHAQALAEFVLAGLLFLVKDLDTLRRDQAEHRWTSGAVASLAGRRALVVGLGHIGRRVAEVLAALGVEVWGAGRPGRRYEGLPVTRLGTTGALDQLLPHVDTVVLATPLTPATQGLIGAGELALLPPGAILVNVGRGAVVDEQAMIAALQEGRLAGACLDVFEQEPLPPSSPLWDIPNVLISPHSAATLESENAALTDLFLDNLDRFVEGRPLRNRFNPEDGY